jgi:prophage regulatory protein
MTATHFSNPTTPIDGEPQTMSSGAAVNRLLRLPQVLERTGISRSMVYLLESQGRFPGRVKVSARAVAWLADEVQSWIDAKKANRRITTDEQAAQALGRALANWDVPVDVIHRSQSADSPSARPGEMRRGAFVGPVEPGGLTLPPRSFRR